MEPWALKQWVEWHEAQDPVGEAEAEIKDILSRNEGARKVLTLFAALNEMAHFEAVTAQMKGLLNEKKTYLTALEELDSKYRTLLERKDDASRSK